MKARTEHFNGIFGEFKKSWIKVSGEELNEEMEEKFGE
jgi:hypothetical protein